MLGLAIGPDPAPWVFSEVAGHPLDVIGAPETWEAQEWIVNGRLLAFTAAGRVVQLASIGSAMAPERMRTIVERGAPIGEVRVGVPT
jgi:hypothetical protein